MNELHSAHGGIVKTKLTARSYFWWPKIDNDIENLARSCQDCIQVEDATRKTELNLWNWPEKPWQRIYTDFIGPIEGETFLLFIDARTKWSEVMHMTKTTAEKMMTVFRKIFSQHGFPLHVISDNEPQYISHELKKYIKRLGIKHTLTAVKHPASNGAAENFVKYFKRKYKILRKEKKIYR